MVALLQIIKSFTEILQTTLIPILSAVANWFESMSPGQQKLVFFLLILVVLLPKLIAIITTVVGIMKAVTIASYVSAGGLGAVSVAGAPLWAIILAIAAAVLALIILFAMLAGKSKDVTKELDRQTSAFVKMNEQYSGMAGDMNLTTGVISSNSTTTTSRNEYSVTIKSEGDI